MATISRINPLEAGETVAEDEFQVLQEVVAAIVRPVSHLGVAAAAADVVVEEPGGFLEHVGVFQAEVPVPLVVVEVDVPQVDVIAGVQAVTPVEESRL